MRNYSAELEKRVQWIRNVLKQSKAEGIVFGNSGGKDSALVGILCKAACENTLGVMMPCCSRQNYESDLQDALQLAKQFAIETQTIDLSELKRQTERALRLPPTDRSRLALTNVNPRLRMTVLYALAQSRNALVAGTGNRSERVMGYFTKWGDGACDFNPIADLTASEVQAFLKHLGAPRHIWEKAPSAGLYDGQTDEADLGLTYRELDTYLTEGTGTDELKARVLQTYKRTQHKREMPRLFASDELPQQNS